MHWLLLLAILSSSTSAKNGGSTASLNRLAENSLRQQLGGSEVRNVRVAIRPGRGGRGDFDSFDVTLDGFSMDKLMNLNDNANNSNDDSYDDNSRDGNYRNDDSRNDESRDDIDLGYDNWAQSSTRIKASDFDLGDIFKNPKIDGALGDILGLTRGGRIGKISLRATNFSFGGARYDSMQANLGEVRFDWAKALRGQFDVKSVSPGTLGLQLRADQAVRLLSPRLPSVQNLSVRFRDGRAFIGGKSNWYGVRVPFEVGAKLSLNANQVRAADWSASVAKLRLPSFATNELTRNVNPIYDFDPKNRWPLQVNLQTAGTPNNALSLRGGLKWRGFNNQNSR